MPISASLILAVSFPFPAVLDGAAAAVVGALPPAVDPGLVPVVAPALVDGAETTGGGGGRRAGGRRARAARHHDERDGDGRGAPVGVRRALNG